MATKTVGVKELKNQATQLVRYVREHQAEVVVTHDGEPVAVLRPFHEDDDQARSDRLRVALKRADALAKKIADAWTSDLSAAEAVAEQRR
jgi:prevent-host-death family protein